MFKVSSNVKLCYEISNSWMYLFEIHELFYFIDFFMKQPVSYRNHPIGIKCVRNYALIIKTYAVRNIFHNSLVFSRITGVWKPVVSEVYAGI